MTKTKEEINSTYSNLKVSDTINFKTLLEAKSKIDSLIPATGILRRIEICRKHWKEVEKLYEIKSSSDPRWSSLTGIEVVIKPYLKKPRLYYN